MTDKNDLCDLCGFQLKRNAVSKKYSDNEKHFCCHGCQFVYDIFIETGKYTPESFLNSDIYKKFVDSGFIRNEKKKTSGNEEPLTGDQKHYEDLFLKIDGMWCSICANLIDYVLSETKGIICSNTNFSTDIAVIKYSPYEISNKDIIEKISNLGYSSSETNSSSKQKNFLNSLMIRTGLAVVFALNIMMLNIVFYPRIIDNINFEEGRFVAFLLLFFTTILLFFIGFPVLKKAWSDIKFGFYGMEVLISIGVLVSYFYSAVLMFINPVAELYFDTSANLMALLFIGQLIESIVKSRAAESLSALYQNIPSRIRIIENEKEKFINIKESKVGDEFMIKEGEIAPLDGEVIQGEGFFDESILTGEAKEVNKNIGDSIISGSILNRGSIKAKVTNLADDSFLKQIIISINNAINTKPKVQKFTDRLSRIFTPLILFISISSFFINYFILDYTLSSSLLKTISIIVIACPCAMAIATPMAIMIAVSGFRKKGIILRRPDIFEIENNKYAVVLDKTGTVTKGEFSFLGIKNISELNDIELYSLIYSIESKSSHPAAAAIKKYLSSFELITFNCNDYIFYPGEGIEGKINGNIIRCGKKNFCSPNSDELNGHHLSQIENNGYLIIFISINELIHGYLWLGDEINPYASGAINSLNQKGYPVHLISGDIELNVKKTADYLNIKYFKGDLKPDNKIIYLQTLKKQNFKIIMVGDGINDAPSLSYADIGIAANNSTNLAQLSSSVILTDQNLTKVNLIIDYAKKVRNIIHQNLIWALLYNIIAIFLAFQGYINPLIAVIAMIFSSVSVMLNSLRLRRIREV